MVKRFWPGQDPIGKRIKLGRATSDSPWLSIVGVVGEVKYRRLPENPTTDPDLYFPFLERNNQVALAVRTDVPPAQLIAPIRAAIRSVDASIPLYGIATMDERIAGQTARSRFMMWLMGAFAAMALLLSVVGVYGVISYLVVRRTREIGIRLAIGASKSEIMKLVVGNGARLIAGGIVVGAWGAIALHRLVATLFYGVAVADASAVLAVALLALMALAACSIPALRAARIDPIVALRCE